MIGLSKLFVKFINFMKFTYIMQLNNVILKKFKIEILVLGVETMGC